MKHNLKKGNSPVNLSISEPVTAAIRVYLATSKRKNRKNLSELTENLWISYLRRKGAKLPPLFKAV